MAKQLGAINNSGILQPASGNNLTFIQQKNGVIRMSRLYVKRPNQNKKPTNNNNNI